MRMRSTELAKNSPERLARPHDAIHSQLQHFYRAAWNADAVYSDEKAARPSA